MAVAARTRVDSVNKTGNLLPREVFAWVQTAVVSKTQYLFSTGTVAEAMGEREGMAKY